MASKEVSPSVASGGGAVANSEESPAPPDDKKGTLLVTPIVFPSSSIPGKVKPDSLSKARRAAMGNRAVSHVPCHSPRQGADKKPKRRMSLRGKKKAKEAANREDAREDAKKEEPASKDQEAPVAARDVAPPVEGASPRLSFLSLPFLFSLTLPGCRRSH